MNDAPLRLRLATFLSALGRLDAALAQPKSEWTRDSAIQRFEFTFELAWKLTALLAREEGLDAYSPREALRTAHRLGWLAGDELWLDMLDARNRTSHTYHEATAEAIYQRLPAYATALRALHSSLARSLDGSRGTTSSGPGPSESSTA